ncbi:MAG: hypothetical protein ACKOOE_03465 [Micrococcales bacterium]
MITERQKQLAKLSPEGLHRYMRARFISIASGTLSLFSFWILVDINEATPYPSGGHLGNMLRLVEWAPMGVLGAIAGIVVAVIFRSIAVEIRKSAESPEAK